MCLCSGTHSTVKGTYFRYTQHNRWLLSEVRHTNAHWSHPRDLLEKPALREGMEISSARGWCGVGADRERPRRDFGQWKDCIVIVVVAAQLCVLIRTQLSTLKVNFTLCKSYLNKPEVKKSPFRPKTLLVYRRLRSQAQDPASPRAAGEGLCEPVQNLAPGSGLTILSCSMGLPKPLHLFISYLLTCFIDSWSAKLQTVRPFPTSNSNAAVGQSTRMGQ